MVESLSESSTLLDYCSTDLDDLFSSSTDLDELFFSSTDLTTGPHIPVVEKTEGSV